VINDSNIGGMSGAPVQGPDDRKIGSVGQVFVDPDTGMPNWITVHTGLFGRRESFVPLDGATWDNEVIRVAIDKDIIKDAPRIDAGEPLTPENEAALYRYYTTQATNADAGVGEVPSRATAGREEASVPGRSRLRQYQRPSPDAAAVAGSAATDSAADTGTAAAATDSAAEADTAADTGGSAGTGARAVRDGGESAQPRGRHVRED
jgi:hypothetical protein